MSRQERLNKVNDLVKTIADNGRGFFRHKDRYAYMEMDDRKRLWWVDECKGSKIYLHYRYWGARKFSNGGTLHNLVDAFKNFVMTGDLINRHHFYWPSFYSQGDAWGYGQDMKLVRDAAQELQMVREEPV